MTHAAGGSYVPSQAADPGDPPPLPLAGAADLLRRRPRGVSSCPGPDGGAGATAVVSRFRHSTLHCWPTDRPGDGVCPGGSSADRYTSRADWPDGSRSGQDRG